MFLKFEAYIALRYLRAKRRDRFISIISLFSLIGIMIGVATLIVVMAVMNGFETELRSRILGMNGHLTLFSKEGGITPSKALTDQLKALPELERIVPFVEGQGLLTTKNGGSTGIVFRGLDSIDQNDFIKDALDIKEKDAFLLKENEVLIGSKLANHFHLRRGDSLTLLSPEVRMTAFGALPRQGHFKVSAIFETGMYEYDNHYVFLPMLTAQAFLGLDNKIQAYELFIKNPDLVYEAERTLFLKLDPMKYYVSNWQTSSPFFESLAVERNVMFIILTLIIIVAAFNVISSMIMLVKDKSDDIAILRTMGASKGQIRRIFILTGASIGLFGAFLGFVLGVSIALNIEEIRSSIQNLVGADLFSAEVYYLTQLPSKLIWKDVLHIMGIASILSILATLYPAWRASSMDPVEALRHG